MIVFPKGLVLSAPAAGQPLTHSRIGWQTFTRGLSASDVTVSSETADGPRDRPLRPDTAAYWTPVSLPATWEVDFGRMVDIDYVGIVANLGSARCGIDLDTSLDPGVYVPFSQSVAPGDDRARLFIDTQRQARRLRLTISGVTPPRLAVVYAGKLLQMQRPIYAGHAPMDLSRQTVLYSAMSRGGEFLGQNLRRTGLTGSASFQNLTAAWIRSDFDPFMLAARRFPYFFGWRPATFPNECAYCWSPDGIPAPSNMGRRDYMQVSWGMMGRGYA